MMTEVENKNIEQRDGTGGRGAGMLIAKTLIIRITEIVFLLFILYKMFCIAAYCVLFLAPNSNPSLGVT